MRVIYLFIVKIYSKYSDKKEKTRNILVSAKRPLHTPKGHFVIAANGVFGNGHSNGCINTFLYYHSVFKRCALLS